MLYIIVWSISFVVGCVVAAIIHMKKVKRMNEEIVERIKFEKALREMTQDEIQALYTTLGPFTAKKVIMTRYTVNHEL